MKHFKLSVFFLSLIIITGCAGTSLKVDQGYAYTESDFFSYEIIDEAGVSDEGMSIFKTRLDANLKRLGLDGTDPDKVIEITFNSYRMRHGAARALVGIMAGKDNITSTVFIKEKTSGNILGKIQVVSQNPTATGTARGLIEQHADKITSYIKTGKK